MITTRMHVRTKSVIGFDCGTQHKSHWISFVARDGFVSVITCGAVGLCPRHARKTEDWLRARRLESEQEGGA